MDVFPKFIIEDGELVIAKVTYHKEIAIDPKKVQGGGWFRYDNETKTFTLYGDSHDFGAATLEDIQLAVRKKLVYTDRYRIRNISESHKFKYDTGSEIIDLA